MEGIEDAGGVLELIVDGVLSVPGRDPPSRSGYRSEGYRSETVRRALLASSYTLCQTCLGPGLTSGPWDDPPLEWSTMPVSSRGPRRRRSWWCHTCSSTPSTRTPAKTGRVIRCGLQARLDMGPHSIPRSCQLSSQASDSGSFEAQLSDRPTDHPHTQTRPGNTHRVVLLNESHDPAGTFATYPASLKPPEPCRDPGPGRVDHLHHHAPVALSKSPRNPGNQPADCTTQHRAPEYLGCEPRSSDGSPPNRRADHTEHNGQATCSSSR